MICSEISLRAREQGLPEAFFARLIWKESLFNPGAESPKGAQGIAQFMPETARLRGLADPFDPLPAIAASARYLKELRAAFGNLGLAAAAYNAGEARAQRFKQGESGLPGETQDYVLAVTGRNHEDWLKPETADTVAEVPHSPEAGAVCNALVAGRAPADETPKRAQAGSKPWSVVLSGGFSEARALQSYNRLRVRFVILREEQAMVVRRKNLSRGRKSMVQVGVGRESRSAAEKLCRELSKRGASCIVAKN